MTEVTITVRGTATALLRPERATVALTVTHDGLDRAAVVRDTSRVAAEVTALITAATERPEHPIERWASDTVHIWSERPWTQDGVQQDHVHRATMPFTLVVGDFPYLEVLVDDLAGLPGVTVEGVSWSLTDDTLETALGDARERAVLDAVAKATVYARSIGSSTVLPVAVADAGMLGDGQPTSSRDDHPMMLRSAEAGAPGLSLRPAEITVSAVVDARFRTI